MKYRVECTYLRKADRARVWCISGIWYHTVILSIRLNYYFSKIVEDSNVVIEYDSSKYFDKEIVSVRFINCLTLRNNIHKNFSNLRLLFCVQHMVYIA